jgi:hypothetical protein
MLFVLNVRTIPRMLRWEGHSTSCERVTTFRGLSCCRHPHEEEHTLALVDHQTDDVVLAEANVTTGRISECREETS